MSVPLVAIGDSMTQGVTSGSIFRTEISYPARIVQCLGNFDFKRPNFMGKGGLPLNLEKVLRVLVDSFGVHVDYNEIVQAAVRLQGLLDRTEDYWERGDGTKATETGPLHHNLAISGFQLGDCDTLTERLCRDWLPAPRNNLLSQIPDFPMYRIARRTLNPSYSSQYESLTQISAAKEIAASQGGIENLIFWLGANNCLGTVTNLHPIESTIEDIDRVPHSRKCNLWKPEHFQILLDRVAPKIHSIGAQNVFIGTVPHVTIPPVSRGITPGKQGKDALSADGYYEYYTHFWIADDEFSKDPKKYNYLTREQARYIDRTIDEYNHAIKNMAERYGWHVVDLCEKLDSLAFRRRAGNVTYVFPQGLIDALQKLLPQRLSASGEPLIDTRYIRIVPEAFDPEQRLIGGLIGLDGFHPTPVCYGLIAWEFMKVMEQVGVSVNIPANWWQSIVLSDTLLMDPPANLEYLTDTLGFLYRQTILRKLIDSFV
ncbi:hypothetical protein [Oscillatoria sp. FACHB-1406]|uniref:hypothetical protein n=1 Tax=Oscillatoria sp. FACHB-1406 TaxID=2692846 RepID=UPI0016864694|nr:hypothetical protein [Oscillatoria sp. FACHB-1406]MBD2579783.1 hypothetical protein [Oscillatoria sp. FACHB-1406]